MIVYRIDRQKYTRHILKGFGAALHGGRWNQRNTPAIYASESRALAMLEVVVHTKSIALLPKDKIIVEIALPAEACMTIKATSLPDGWNNRLTVHPLTPQLFQDHCVHGSYIGLKVPSVVIPEEYNIVINPEHKDFKDAVKVKQIRDINWDERLS